MDNKDILYATEASKRLIQDENYYKYIFKKTERIVSVVFYILHNTKESKRTDMHVEDITHAARMAHDAVLHSLESQIYQARDVIRASAHTLIGLESKLRIANVAGVIPHDVLHLLSSEIDAVLRGMNRYTEDVGETLLDGGSDYTHTSILRQKSSSRDRTVQSAGGAKKKVSVLERQDRLKTILEAKGEASIKDITEIITDCSEKTVQRLLTNMIDKGIVKRHGERRWSRYSLV